MPTDEKNVLGGTLAVIPLADLRRHALDLH
jgi:hypothetical protein